MRLMLSVKDRRTAAALNALDILRSWRKFYFCNNFIGFVRYL